MNIENDFKKIIESYFDEYSLVYNQIHFYNLFVEEEFLPVFDINTGRRIEFDEEQLSGRIDVNHELDLTDVLEQYVISELPMKPLCRSDCQGLCQVCGDNLNEKQCNCLYESHKLVKTTLAQLLAKD